MSVSEAGRRAQQVMAVSKRDGHHGPRVDAGVSTTPLVERRADRADAHSVPQAQEAEPDGCGTSGGPHMPAEAQAASPLSSTLLLPKLFDHRTSIVTFGVTRRRPSECPPRSSLPTDPARRGETAHTSRQRGSGHPPESRLSFQPAGRLICGAAMGSHLLLDNMDCWSVRRAV